MHNRGSGDLTLFYRLCQQVTVYWRLAIGDWRLAIGDWLLAIGNWLLARGQKLPQGLTLA